MTERGTEGSPMVRQAGGIVVRVVDGSPRVLIISARENPSHWIFPKGHVEPGESPEATSLREVREETGVAGELVGHVAALDFTSGRDIVHVDYYLITFREQRGPGEGRRMQWCTVDEAQRLLTFEDARRLLVGALPLIERAANRGTASNG